MSNTSRTIFADILMVLLSLISIFLLFSEVVSNLNPAQIELYASIDYMVSLIFLGDFTYNFFRAKNRSHFFKKYWWELLAAIPITTHTTQALRSLKILRILPIIESFSFIRLFARLKLILLVSKKYTKQTALVYIVVLLGIVIFLGALGFHHFEYGINPQVNDFMDSFYWAIITAATVGYGEIYPMTLGGRIVSVILIFSGVATLGAFITIMESYLLGKRK